MITPIDIQNTQFKSGIGYDKKEVDTFKEDILANFEELYRANVELKDKINLLTEGLQHYQAIEVSLQKAVVLAERASEERIKEAEAKAKSIEKEAAVRSVETTRSANDKLIETKKETEELIKQYTAFKVAYARLVSDQMKYLLANNVEKKAFDQALTGTFATHPEDNPFNDMKKYMDLAKNFTGGVSAGTPVGSAPKKAESGDDDFSYGGDPQARDESPLGDMQDNGGLSNLSGGPTRGDIASAGFGFTSLTQNEEFKDPFA